MAFIDQIAPLIQKYAPKYNIQVCSPIIAQAILESASGTSELATKCHNYFGLKYRTGRCKTASLIPYVKVGTEQSADGKYTASSMLWCKFDTMEKGVIGYFDFINVANYNNLKGVTDPETYLKRIKADGYATSVNYVQNLMAVIKKYGLTRFDGAVTNVIAESGFVWNGLDYSAVFDPAYYNSRYPDLRVAFQGNATKLFQHFIQFGMKELRQASAQFNPVAYKNNYFDLRAAFNDNNALYYQHYIRCGIKEGRRAV